MTSTMTAVSQTHGGLQVWSHLHFDFLSVDTGEKHLLKPLRPCTYTPCILVFVDATFVKHGCYKLRWYKDIWLPEAGSAIKISQSLGGLSEK